MSAITICNGVFLHTPHFLLLKCFVRQVQVFTSFIAGLKRASESWSCWLLVELLGLFDGRGAETGSRAVSTQPWTQFVATRLGWPGCPLSRQPRAVDVSVMPAHCGTVPEGQVTPTTVCMVRCKCTLPARDGEGLQIGNVLLERLTSLFWKLTATVLPPPAPHQLVAAFALTWVL